MPDFIWIIIILMITAFLIYATKKHWISWRGGKGIATLTAFHDFQTKDKQAAIEIVIEKQAGKKMEEQKSGEDGESDMGCEK